MFYSNTLSLRRILLEIKKRSPNNEASPEKQKEPDQFEGGGEKERVAGGGKGAEKTINSKAP